MNDVTGKSKLVRAEQMLDAVFAPECKPSLRWLRTQTKAKVVPCIRVGRLVFFDLDAVRAALAGKQVARGQGSPTGTPKG